jgi:predicted lipoprotein with Yx(FWY)xxD motif
MGRTLEHRKQPSKELKMKRKIALFITAAALSGAVLATAAFGESSSASSPRASRGALVALGKTGLGKVLVDSRGRTLYLFEKDKHGRSACYGACGTYWPPLSSSAKPRAGKGVRASLLGLTRRSDGRRQVTYAGHPLYTFFGDRRAGQTNGEGLTDFGGAWDAVAASGRSVEQAAPDSGNGGTGGYGGYPGYGSGH